MEIRPHEVPLYNGLTMLPSRPHRALLHKHLSQLAGIDGGASKSLAKHTDDVKSRETRTFAYLFYSSAQTLQRVDTVPLAIALWRIRMWEGSGWGQSEWLKGSI